MQLTKTLVAATALATTVFAAPGFGNAKSGNANSWFWWPFSQNPALCLPSSVATDLVNGFSGLLTSFTAANAQNFLSASNFSDTSDSINFLAGIPLGSVTFPNQTAFIYGQGAQPAIGLEVLAIDSASCEGVITFRWQADVATRKFPVKGINVLYSSLAPGGDVNKAGAGGWQITQVFSEFNSAAWIVDIGGTITLPQQS